MHSLLILEPQHSGEGQEGTDRGMEEREEGIGRKEDRKKESGAQQAGNVCESGKKRKKEGDNQRATEREMETGRETEGEHLPSKQHPSLTVRLLRLFIIRPRQTPRLLFR